MDTTETVKVYRVSDADWIAAETPIQAVEFYANQVGQTEAEVLEDFITELVSDADMETNTFYDENQERGSIHGITFRAQLEKMIAAGETFPNWFASTEW